MLTGKQKRYLRGLGSTLDPIVFVGKGALTDTVIKSALEAVVAHELVTIRVQQNCPEPAAAIIARLAAEIGAQLVQTIGRNGLVYLPDSEKPKIQLP